MRTKTLIIAGAIAVMGSVASYAQVYSQNTVGFYTINLVQKFNLIANQFMGNPDNNINTVIPATAPVPSDTIVLLWDSSLNTFGPSDTFIQGFGWYDLTDPDNPVPSTKELNPGDGAFLQLPLGTSADLVMVGDVPEGDPLPNPKTLVPGFQLVSQLTPQRLGFNSSPADALPAGADDVILFWDKATQQYGAPARPNLTYSADALVWYYLDAQQNPVIVDPTPEIGEAVFYQRALSNPSVTWNRSFDVSP
jgi:hypothetical protein